MSGDLSYKVSTERRLTRLEVGQYICLALIAVITIHSFDMSAFTSLGGGILTTAAFHIGKAVI